MSDRSIHQVRCTKRDKEGGENVYNNTPPHELLARLCPADFGADEPALTWYAEFGGKVEENHGGNYHATVGCVEVGVWLWSDGPD